MIAAVQSNLILDARCICVNKRSRAVLLQFGGWFQFVALGEMSWRIGNISGEEGVLRLKKCFIS